MPFYTQVEFVEVYGYDAEEKSSQNRGFNLLFRDEFASIDEERWGKGKDKTWGNTGSTIKPANTYVEDGHLVLKVDSVIKKEKAPDGCNCNAYGSCFDVYMMCMFGGGAHPDCVE